MGNLGANIRGYIGSIVWAEPVSIDVTFQHKTFRREFSATSSISLRSDHMGMAHGDTPSNTLIVRFWMSHKTLHDKRPSTLRREAQEQVRPSLWWCVLLRSPRRRNRTWSGILLTSGAAVRLSPRAASSSGRSSGMLGGLPPHAVFML